MLSSTIHRPSQLLLTTKPQQEVDQNQRKKKAELTPPNRVLRALRRNSRQVAIVNASQLGRDKEVTAGTRINRAYGRELHKLYSRVKNTELSVEAAEAYHSELEKAILLGFLSVEGITEERALQLLRQIWSGVLAEVLTLLSLNTISEHSELWAPARFAKFPEDRNHATDIILSDTNKRKQAVQVVSRKTVPEVVSIYTVAELFTNPKLRQQLSIEKRNLGKVGEHISGNQNHLIVVWNLSKLIREVGIERVETFVGTTVSLFRSDFSPVFQAFAQKMK